MVTRLGLARHASAVFRFQGAVQCSRGEPQGDHPAGGFGCADVQVRLAHQHVRIAPVLWVVDRNHRRTEVSAGLRRAGDTGAVLGE